MLTNETLAFFGRICAVRSSAGGVMARQIGPASSPTTSPLSNVRLSSTLEVVSATGGRYHHRQESPAGHRQLGRAKDGIYADSQGGAEDRRGSDKSNHPPAQATPKTGAYDYFRQRAGIRRTRGDQQTTGCGLLFRPPLRLMGTRDERKYQWKD